MKKLILISFLISALATQAQSPWVYNIKLSEVNNSMWDGLPQVYKDYYWNKANNFYKMDLKVQRKKLISLEDDIKTIPAVNEWRDVRMERKPNKNSSGKLKIDKYASWKRGASSTLDYGDGTIITTTVYAKEIGNTFYMHTVTRENGEITDVIKSSSSY